MLANPTHYSECQGTYKRHSPIDPVPLWLVAWNLHKMMLTNEVFAARSRQHHSFCVVTMHTELVLTHLQIHHIVCGVACC
jgi:hypothetical protein